MLKTSGVNQRRYDEMKELYVGAKFGFVLSVAYVVGLAYLDYSEKTALEIKILKHELAAYEAMEKELKSE